VPVLEHAGRSYRGQASFPSSTLFPLHQQHILELFMPGAHAMCAPLSFPRVLEWCPIGYSGCMPYLPAMRRLAVHPLKVAVQDAGFVPSCATLFGCYLFSAMTGLFITEVNINTVCELGAGAVSLQVCLFYALSIHDARSSFQQQGSCRVWLPICLQANACTRIHLSHVDKPAEP
jgi:hypothetical protein